MLEAQSPGKYKQTKNWAGNLKGFGLRTLMVSVLCDDKVSLAPGVVEKFVHIL